MSWRRHVEFEPPARETLAGAAAAVIGCHPMMVVVLYNRVDKATRVGVFHNNRHGYSEVLDSDLACKPVAARVDTWTEAARRAADASLLADAEVSAQTIPMHNYVTTQTQSYYNTQTLMPVYVNPMLPKVGDAVRDANGLVVGIMCADGTIEPVVESLRKAIAAIESDGVPVEPTVIRRAIDLTFGGKGKL